MCEYPCQSHAGTWHNTCICALCRFILYSVYSGALLHNYSLDHANYNKSLQECANYWYVCMVMYVAYTFDTKQQY